MIRLIPAFLFLAVLLAVSGCLSPRLNINVTVDTSGAAQLTTLVQLQQVQEGIIEYYEKYGRLPESLAEVKKTYNAWKPGRKRAKWNDLMKDAWGTLIVYEKTGNVTYKLISYGADRAPGGVEKAEDIVVSGDVTAAVAEISSS